MKPRPPQLTLGVAGVSRKLHSPPLRAILRSLRAAAPSLHLVLLDEAYMSAHTVRAWPVVHALLPLYSPAFPLQKVLDYVALRRPVLVNNLHRQCAMMDRRDIRAALHDAAVPTPPGLVLDRDRGDTASQTAAGDLLVVRSADGARRSICKPFVEKPVDPEDHNVYIYYKGGGVRKLFRKTKRESSHLYPTLTAVRATGNYIYEKFYTPEHRADIKVYAVGDYFHAEARKAPHIDGIVDRDPRGLERRRLVRLTRSELAICRKAAAAFDQFLLGFDLLRGPNSTAFVIDVNGWSLVKNSEDYAVRCGRLLADRIYAVLHPCPVVLPLRDDPPRAQPQARVPRLHPPVQQPPSPPQSSPVDMFDPSPSSPCPV